MALKGITKRWFRNSLLFLALILILIESSFIFFVGDFFYKEASQKIISHVFSLNSIFRSSGEENENVFRLKAIEYIEEFDDKNLMTVEALNEKGNKFFSSDTLDVSKENFELTEDFYNSQTSQNHTAKFIGKIQENKKIISVTKTVFNKENQILGAVRFIFPLEETERAIWGTILLSVIIALFVLIFIVLSSLYFLKSILKPIAEIGKTARRIALGDFNTRLQKKRDDEIGELCETVNYMAKKLGDSEKMKNDFISSVSHELRTPLTAIKGWAETIQLADEKDTQMTQKGLSIIVGESERLCGIVEELLDFSRMQNGRMILKFDKIDILAEISEAVYMFKERALCEKKHIIYNEKELLSPILGDKNKLRQVFINLIDNALKYTQEGGIVEVNTEQENEFINIIIRDNGCGIPQEHLPKVKEKFYKANTTQKGSGIGLAVAEEIINMHSGTLNIISEENEGTAAIVSLPIIREIKQEKI